MTTPLSAIVVALMILTAFFTIVDGCRIQTEYKDTSNLRICSEKDHHDIIRWLWEKRKPVYINWVTESSNNPYHLYNIQGETNNLLKYAALSKDNQIIEELVWLYSLSLKTLDETDRYAYYYLPGQSRRSIHKLNSKHKMWLDDTEPVGNENILASSQFLYVLSEATAIVSKLPHDKQTQMMKNSTQQFVSVLLDHYERWIFGRPGHFQVRGWGCKKNNKYVSSAMNHFNFLEKKSKKALGDNSSPKYCNAVTDTDLWIIAGVANLLAANRYDKDLVKISPKKYSALLRYITLGVKLLNHRFVNTELENFDGKKVTGALFDPGVWDDYHSYTYSGYCNENFPLDTTLSKKMRGQGLGWDLSHARRYVHVFGALFQHRAALNLNFPSENIMKMLTNQFLYATFNRDFNRPLFANFMDGSNGWFRVRYASRPGFGYGPWDMSLSALEGGYCFWSLYNCDVKTVFQALFKMICSNDPVIKKHVNCHYEKNHWNKFTRPKNIDFNKMDNEGLQSVLIQFLPSYACDVKSMWMEKCE